jgi:hypothetical protein
MSHQLMVNKINEKIVSHLKPSMKLRRVELWEVPRTMPDKTRLLPLITFTFRDLGFSSSRFRRFGTTQSTNVLRILSARVTATAPHNNGEAFLGGLNSRARGSVFLPKRPAAIQPLGRREQDPCGVMPARGLEALRAIPLSDER